MFLRFGADPNISNEIEVVPLHYVANSENTMIAQQLLRSGADPNKTTVFGTSPLSIASMQSKYLPMVKLLLSYGADPNMQFPLLAPLLHSMLISKFEY